MPTLSGDMQYGTAGTEVDFDKDLGLEADNSNYAYVDISHF